MTDTPTRNQRYVKALESQSRICAALTLPIEATELRYELDRDQYIYSFTFAGESESDYVTVRIAMIEDFGSDLGLPFLLHMIEEQRLEKLERRKSGQPFPVVGGAG